MAVNVTVDQGNTSMKLSVWDSGRMCFQTSGNPLSSEVIDRIVAEHGNPDTAIVSSVAPVDNRFDEALQRECQKVIRLDYTTPMPLYLDYHTPATLGHDRIAAMVGAMTLYPRRNLLVVDAGTAVTYDAVTADGHFIGGNIAAGIYMRLKALHAHTARLPMIDLIGDIPPLGHDTESALRSGAINGVVAETMHYRALLPPDTLVVLTGGDALILNPLISDIEKVVEPNLIHTGLNSIIAYNENQ